MKTKIKDWLKRYLPAEILSVIITVISSIIAFKTTNNAITTAFVGTWAGNIAYFGYILISDVLKSINKCHLRNIPYTKIDFLLNIKALALEFGIAELIDSLFIRPALMYYFPIWVGDLTLGVLIAKIAADVTFYIPAIISYEMSKKYIKN